MDHIVNDCSPTLRIKEEYFYWQKFLYNSASPGVEEDELHVQTGSEHEHVAVQLDLGDGTRRQRVTHSHKAHVLVAALKRRHIQAVLADLQVAATVDHLWRGWSSSSRMREGWKLCCILVHCKQSKFSFIYWFV